MSSLEKLIENTFAKYISIKESNNNEVECLIKQFRNSDQSTKVFIGDNLSHDELSKELRKMWDKDYKDQYYVVVKEECFWDSSSSHGQIVLNNHTVIDYSIGEMKKI